jgi:hypothetical protein
MMKAQARALYARIFFMQNFAMEVLIVGVIHAAPADAPMQQKSRNTQVGQT